MGRVNTTVSFTPCCTRPPPERAGLRRPGWLWAALVCLLALWIAAIPAAHAQQHGEIIELQLDPLPEGLYLSATLQLELPELVKDALYKGISVFFITEAEVVRQRWYWSDKVVAQASRFLRLSYQPLRGAGVWCSRPRPLHRRAWACRWAKILTRCRMRWHRCSASRAGRSPTRGRSMKA